MKLEKKLILGSFHPELERAFFQAVLEMKGDDFLRPVVVLVGSNLLQLYLRRKMALSMVGHVNVRFVTFMDLASILADGKLEDSGRIRAPVAVEELFAKEVCSRTPGDGYFYPVKHLRGFHRLLRNVFSDLRISRVVVEQLTCVGGLHDKHIEKKLLELSFLYGCYQERLSEGAYDESDLFRLAAKEAAAFSQRLGADVLLVYGIYDFNEAQRNLLESLFPHLNVHVFLPWEQTRAYRYTKPTLSWLKRMGFRPIRFLKPKTAHSLDKLRHRLFAAGPRMDMKALGPCVTVVAAPGEAGEIREVAREILHHARNGVPFHEMGVLLRNREPYARLVQETFDSLGIPYCLIPGAPLESSLAGRGVRMLLDLVGTPLRRFDVMEFIASAPVPIGTILECAEDECSLAEWDVLSMEAGIVQGRGQWIKRLNDLEKRYNLPVEQEESGELRIREEKRKQASLFRRFITILLDDLDTLPDQASWARWVELTMSLIKRYILSDADGLEEVLKAVEELGVLECMIPKASLADFRETVFRTLSQKSLKTGSFQRSGVNVCGLMESRGLSFPVVFAPGLADGLFPAPFRPDPILTDAERKALCSEMGDPDALPLKKRRAAEEELLFALAVGAARQRLILTYPHLEPLTGRPRQTSTFLIHLAEALEGRRINPWEIKGSSWHRWIQMSLQRPTEDTDALDEEEYHLARMDEDCESAIQCLEHFSPVFSAARKAYAARRMTTKMTPYDGALSSKQARELLRRRFLPAHVMLSPTVLEEYARCPFRCYLDNVLALKPLQEPEQALTFPSRERGLLIHRILRDFYQWTLDRNEIPLLPSRISTYKRIMHRVVERWCAWQEARGPTGHQMAWGLARERLQMEMEEFIHEELIGSGSFRPRYLEVGFPPRPHDHAYDDLDLSPLKLRLDAQTIVALQGRVDRIDLAEDGLSARVVDYKSGKRGFKPDDFQGGRQIQLPVYALAARQMLASMDVQHVDAQYYYIGGQGKFRRDKLSSDKIRAMEVKLREIVAIIVQGILSGLFMPAGDEEKCKNCDYKAACGSIRWAAFSRKKNDPTLEPFHRLRDIRT